MFIIGMTGVTSFQVIHALVLGQYQILEISSEKQLNTWKNKPRTGRYQKMQTKAVNESARAWNNWKFESWVVFWLFWFHWRKVQLAMKLLKLDVSLDVSLEFTRCITRCLTCVVLCSPKRSEKDMGASRDPGEKHGKWPHCCQSDSSSNQRLSGPGRYESSRWIFAGLQARLYNSAAKSRGHF